MAVSVPNTRRVALTLVVAALLVLFVPVWWFVARPAPTHAPAAVEVHDEAGVLDPASMERQVKDIRFWADNVDVAVVTAGDLEDQSLNDWVLDYARGMDGEPWISKQNTDKWADGLFIMAVAPTDRLVGTYFGEDVKVGLDTQQSIQDATKDQFREGDWSGGLVSGVRAGAGEMAKPGLREAVDIGSGVGGAGGLLGIGLLFNRRRSTKAAIQQARTAWANVTRDFDATQVTAGTIPADDHHGAEVLNRLAIFQQDYHQLARDFLDFGEPTGLALFSKETADTAQALATSADTLDATDDSIAHAAEFLNLSSQWREAWENELGPIREDLGALEELLKDNASDVPQEDYDGATAMIRKATGRIDQMTADLDARVLTPSAALDELDQMDDGAHQWADRIIGQLMKTGDADEQKRRRDEWDDTDWSQGSSYTGSWTLGGRSGSYGENSTIRTTPGMPGYSSAIDSRTAPIGALVIGYSAANSAATASASDSGGGSGYSGGGGFSGAGSSSSF